MTNHTTRAQRRRAHLYPIIGGVLTLTALGAIVAAIVTVASDPTSYRSPYELPACVTEDSDNCYWDAPNGGRSFYIVDGHLTYSDNNETRETK